MLRRATAEDLGSIQVLLDAAFVPSKYESTLVGFVRNSGEDYHDWVFQLDGQVVAYILYTQALREGESIGWHLAPVAVHPEHQSKGIGSQLIQQALLETPIADGPVFVLGDPHYYERFGFMKTHSAQCPYDPGNEHFRALRWTELDAHFEAGYSDAFKKTEIAIENHC